MAQNRTTSSWERYGWVAGVVFVIALVAESVGSTGVGLTQNDSAGKIATGLYEHRTRLLLIAYVSVVYAAAFPVYLCSLYALLRGDPGRARIVGLLVLIGGVLFIVLRAVSDIGITGLLVAFVLFLVFVLASSGIMLRRVPAAAGTGGSA